MFSQEATKREIGRRVSRFQGLLKEKDCGAGLVLGAGAPGQVGGTRYLTNINLWSNRIFVVVDKADPDPEAYIWSSYQAEWAKEHATTSKIFSPDDVQADAVAAVKRMAGSSKRIGVVNFNRLATVGEAAGIKKALDGYELVEITGEFNKIRSIKSPWEIEALFETGRINDEAFDVFAQVAHIGGRVWDAAAEAERHIKAQGCFWGRSKVALDRRPYTIPTPPDRRFTKDDIICFELCYEGPQGYWTEMSAVYSFGPLPKEDRRLLDATLGMVDACAEAALPETPIGNLAKVADDFMRAKGFNVVGKHTPDCHSIGLDGGDGPNSDRTPKELLKANMTLSFHPSPMIEGERAFLISDNFLVTQTGAARLSPHTKFYHELEG
ncbi:MAG: aminopeptidase P family protein [Armatimonadetes bacterium]|nr:aminopeptidase P family protein [Armatimonadota bacterium]